MAQAPEEVGEAVPLRPFRVLPGGAEAIPAEVWSAGIMAGALVLLWAMRRGLGRGDHVHISGTDAIVFVLYYLIVTGMVRVALDFASKGGDRDTPLTRGLAFYA